MTDTEATRRGTVFLVEQDAGDGGGGRVWWATGTHRPTVGVPIGAPWIDCAAAIRLAVMGAPWPERLAGMTGRCFGELIS